MKTPVGPDQIFCFGYSDGRSQPPSERPSVKPNTSPSRSNSAASCRLSTTTPRCVRAPMTKTAISVAAPRIQATLSLCRKTTGTLPQGVGDSHTGDSHTESDPARRGIKDPDPPPLGTDGLSGRTQPNSRGSCKCWTHRSHKPNVHGDPPAKSRFRASSGFCTGLRH